MNARHPPDKRNCGAEAYQFVHCAFNLANKTKLDQRPSIQSGAVWIDNRQYSAVADIAIPLFNSDIRMVGKKAVDTQLEEYG